MHTACQLTFRTSLPEAAKNVSQSRSQTPNSPEVHFVSVAKRKAVILLVNLRIDMDHIIHLEFHHASRVTKRSRFHLGTNLSMLEIFPHYERRPLQSNNLTLSRERMPYPTSGKDDRHRRNLRSDATDSYQFNCFGSAGMATAILSRRRRTQRIKRFRLRRVRLS
jgi:hypothetical protein